MKVNIFFPPTKNEQEELDREEIDKYLPIGHTCFFSIDLPNYSTIDILREKLIYALDNCLTIDADLTTNARAAAAQDLSELLLQNRNDVQLGF